MEGNNGKEVWQTIGAIVGAVSGVIALILQGGKLISLGIRILKWFRGMLSMLKQWWYWKRRSPSFSIMERNAFRIVKLDGSAEIAVTMSCQSRVKTIDKTIIEGKMLLDIGGTIPKLICSTSPLVLTPREKKEKIVYKFRGNIHVASLVSLEDSIKQIGSVVRCRIQVEKILIRGLGDRSINLKPFKANVELIN